MHMVRGDETMQAQRAGSNRLIQARMRAYSEAVKAGKTSQEAYEAAKQITRKQTNKQHREKAGR